VLQGRPCRRVAAHCARKGGWLHALLLSFLSGDVRGWQAQADISGYMYKRFNLPT
jgi:hypothetical protein